MFRRRRGDPEETQLVKRTVNSDGVRFSYTEGAVDVDDLDEAERGAARRAFKVAERPPFLQWIRDILGLTLYVEDALTPHSSPAH